MYVPGDPRDVGHRHHRRLPAAHREDGVPRADARPAGRASRTRGRRSSGCPSSLLASVAAPLRLLAAAAPRPSSRRASTPIVRVPRRRPRRRAETGRGDHGPPPPPAAARDPRRRRRPPRRHGRPRCCRRRAGLRLVPVVGGPRRSPRRSSSLLLDGRDGDAVVGHFVVDGFSRFVRGLVLGGGVLLVLVSASYTRRMDRGHGEFYATPPLRARRRHARRRASPTSCRCSSRSSS